MRERDDGELRRNRWRCLEGERVTEKKSRGTDVGRDEDALQDMQSCEKNKSKKMFGWRMETFGRGRQKLFVKGGKHRGRYLEAVRK